MWLARFTENCSCIFGVPSIPGYKKASHRLAFSITKMAYQPLLFQSQLAAGLRG
jgi:hypothetical protein